MTIASEITKLNTNLTNSYTACNNKGATMPANQNFDNLATCIGSIQTGSTPTLITKTITQNGTYNASSDNADGYSSVTVNVSGGGGGDYTIIQADSYSIDLDNGDTLTDSSAVDTQLNLVFDSNGYLTDAYFVWISTITGFASFHYPNFETAYYVSIGNNIAEEPILINDEEETDMLYIQIMSEYGVPDGGFLSVTWTAP